MKKQKAEEEGKAMFTAVEWFDRRSAVRRNGALLFGVR